MMKLSETLNVEIKYSSNKIDTNNEKGREDGKQ